MLYVSALVILFGALASLSNRALGTPVPKTLFGRSTENGYLSLGFQKTKRHASLSKRQDALIADLINDVYSYEVEVDVGTPPQTTLLQVDTGSSDLFVNAPKSCDTNTCTCPEDGCTYFDATESSTAEVLTDENGDAILFNFTYGIGSVEGAYITDDISIAGASLSAVVIGVATVNDRSERGILGVGLPEGEFDYIQTHPGVIQELVQEGYIEANAYSIALDDWLTGSGTLILGGIDDSLYTGELVTLPIVPSPDGEERLTVAWTGFEIYSEGELAYSAAGSSLDLGPATLLDTGSTLSYIPDDIFADLVDAFELALDAETESVYLCDCAVMELDGWIDFTFGDGDSVISVPFGQIVRPGDDEGEVCLFGLQPAGDVPPLILGDTFLTSAFTYYDLDAYEISIAQAAWVGA